MSSSVAIVIPVYREKLTTNEEMSFRHLQCFLGHYDKYFAAPAKLQFSYANFEKKLFHDRYFTDVDAYSRLLLSRHFYQAFAEYDYILIYQLDCLVFSDQLAAWCQAGYDYVGAPWFKVKNDPASGFSRVGNGGLSLRKVKSFLRVINSDRYIKKPVSLAREALTFPLQDMREKFGLVRGYYKTLQVLRAVRRGAGAYMASYGLNEDHFWSDRARLFYPQFNVAPVDAALRFAFECAPRYCFAQNGTQLPFGCHAWAKWDQAFWEPHLLK